MDLVKNIKVEYIDGTSDTFDEKDNPEYQDRHDITVDDWLRYRYSNDDAILKLDTRRTRTIISMSAIKKIHIIEKE